MKWEEGVVYKISPKTKKSVVYIQIYEKDGLEIKYAEAYRSGWVTVLGDEMLGGYMSLEEMRGDSNSDGTDVWGLPTEDHEFLDGVSDGITYPETLSEADRDQLESIYYKMEHFTNHEMYSDFDVALAGLSFRGGGKSTDEKFAKQWSEETEDDIMIYDEWKDKSELEGRGWDIIKTEFIFMDGLKLDP